MSYDVIVLGGDADALVAAHLLARAGRRVLVLAEHPRGGASTGWVPAPVVRELGLQLQVEPPDPWATVLLPGGGTLELWRDVRRTSEAIRRLSEKDARAWPEFCRRMAVLARLFEQVYTAPPVDPLDFRFALRVRGLGREAMVDLMRLLPMSVAELLDDWFECDPLKGALAAMGIVHIQQGPRSGGTAFRFLHHHVGCAEGVFRPAPSNLATVLRERKGVEIRSHAVERIRVKGGRVDGVVIGGGDEISASLVVSSLDARRTLLQLSDPAWLDPELVRSIRHVRQRGAAARLSFPGALKTNLVHAPSLDYLERAYDEVKYGRVSREPYLEASPGAEGIEVLFQFVPQRGEHDLAAEARRRIPGLADARGAVQWPVDLERSEGWPEGQPYHAELALDQALWMRPVPELAHYRTPIEGLWLCGPGTHPGGGIGGASGYNCARAILKEKK